MNTVVDPIDCISNDWVTYFECKFVQFNRRLSHDIDPASFVSITFVNLHHCSCFEHYLQKKQREKKKNSLVDIQYALTLDIFQIKFTHSSDALALPTHTHLFPQKKKPGHPPESVRC